MASYFAKVKTQVKVQNMSRGINIICISIQKIMELPSDSPFQIYRINESNESSDKTRQIHRLVSVAGPTVAQLEVFFSSDYL